MKIKIFTTNNKGEIVLNKKDLEELLNEAYWEGYGNGRKYYSISTPYYTTTPYYTWTTSGGSSTITLCSNDTSTASNTSGTVTVNGGEYTGLKSADIPSYTTTATTTTVPTSL